MQYSTTTATGFAEYHEARGRTIPGTWDEDYINASLLVASEWVDGIYGNSFIGEKTAGFLQEREWPRQNAVIYYPKYSYVFATDEIPERITNAVYEAAFIQASEPGSLLVNYTPNKYKSVSIDGAISVEFAGFTTSAQIQKTFPKIDQLLEPLLCSESMFSSMSGLSSRV